MSNPGAIRSSLSARSQLATSRRHWRRNVATPLVLVLGLGLAACGGDDDDADADVDDDAATTTVAAEPAPADPPATDPPATDPPATDPPATDPPATDPPATDPPATDPPAAEGAGAEFCDAFVSLEAAFQQAPSEDPDAIGPYVEAEILPRLETIRANLPEAVADEVTVLVDAIESVATTGEFGAMETPEFAEAQATVYPWLGEGCALPVVEVAAVDYAFGGVPMELEPGPTVFTLVNESEAGEAHEMGFARVKDGVDLTLDELLALPMEELEQNVEIAGGTYAPADASSSTIVQLTEGRWVYVCFIPVGSVHGEEGSGPPHVAEGMVGELIVG